MTLGYIISNVDKSDRNSCHADLPRIADELNIAHYDNFNWDDENLKCYHFVKWYCTDSYVGGRVYFLRDKPVMTSWQTGRKASEDFSFISNEARNELRDYIISLVLNSDTTTEVNAIDLEEDWGEGFKVSYGSQLLTDDVIYEPTKEKVKVTKKYGDDYKDIELWSFIEILFPDGRKDEVNVKDILVPFCLKK